MANAISFFAGAGGLDLGITRAGFEILLANEIEKTYCDTLIGNGHENVVQGDIMQYNALQIRELAGLGEEDEIDLVMGGSPCQSFSTAGNRQAFTDPRGQAMLKFAELVEGLRPKVFILENVRGFLSAALKHRPINKRGKEFAPLEEDEKPGTAYKYLINKFRSYQVDKHLVNAADYGVPQKRNRVFIIGIRNDFRIDYTFPPKTHDRNGKNNLSKWRTFQDVMNELEDQEIVHKYLEYSQERMKYMKMIPIGGGNWRDLAKVDIDLAKEAMGGAFKSGGGKVGFYRRIDIDSPAPTLLTSPIQKSTNLGHPIENRPLSIQEYLEIQGFPLDYYVSGTLSQQYVQIGNAVPVQLAEIIGKSFIDYF